MTFTIHVLSLLTLTAALLLAHCSGKAMARRSYGFYWAFWIGAAFVGTYALSLARGGQ